MKKLLVLVVVVLTAACQTDPIITDVTSLNEKRVSAFSTELTQMISCNQTAIYPFESGFSPGAQIGNAAVTVTSDSAVIKYTAQLDWFFVSGSAWIGNCESWPENPADFPYQQIFDINDEVRSFTIAIPLAAQPKEGCLNFSTKLAFWYQKYEDGPQLAQAELQYLLQYTKCHSGPSTLSLIVTEKGSPKPVAASAYLVSGGDTLNHYTLKPSVNKIALPVNLNEAHKLIINKESYEPYTLNLSAIGSETRKPIRIILEPAFFILSYTNDFSFNNSFEFYMGARDDGVVTVNWGDGVVEVTEMQMPRQRFFHHYPGPGNYPITISGDLDNIKVFHAGFGNGAIDKIEFKHLNNIEEISFGLSRSPAVLDFTRNTLLEMVILTGLDNLEKVILPPSHNISQVALDGPNRMTTVAVDAVVDNLYRNTTRKNIRGGFLAWRVSWVQEDDSILGPPSATSLTKVKIMKENYGWSFHPDPFDPLSNTAHRENLMRLKGS